jgi:hypothetical protein
MRVKCDIDPVYLRENLEYNQETGKFFWKKRRSGCRPGQEAGHFEANGYRVICLDRSFYKAHRLAWLYVTGSWPSEQLDHINGIRADNRFVNLRQASHTQNAKNRKHQTNQTGFAGVERINAKSPRFRARIGNNGKHRDLGCFDSAEAAHAAYQAATLEYFGEFARRK